MNEGINKDMQVSIQDSADAIQNVSDSICCSEKVIPDVSSYEHLFHVVSELYRKILSMNEFLTYQSITSLLNTICQQNNIPYNKDLLHLVLVYITFVDVVMIEEIKRVIPLKKGKKPYFIRRLRRNILERGVYKAEGIHYQIYFLILKSRENYDRNSPIFKKLQQKWLKFKRQTVFEAIVKLRGTLSGEDTSILKLNYPKTNFYRGIFSVLEQINNSYEIRKIRNVRMFRKLHNLPANLEFSDFNQLYQEYSQLVNIYEEKIAKLTAKVQNLLKKVELYREQANIAKAIALNACIPVFVTNEKIMWDALSRIPGIPSEVVEELVNYYFDTGLRAFYDKIAKSKMK
ncbi:hypothetical protein [Thermodesulfovibrio hydrogeniphilus]